MPCDLENISLSGIVVAGQRKNSTNLVAHDEIMKARREITVFLLFLSCQSTNSCLLLLSVLLHRGNLELQHALLGHVSLCALLDSGLLFFVTNCGAESTAATAIGVSTAVSTLSELFNLVSAFTYGMEARFL